MESSRHTGAATRRHLPSVDAVLNAPAVAQIADRWGAQTTKQAVRAVLAELRSGDDLPAWAATPDAYAIRAEKWLERTVGHGYVPVFNLTGTLVHTNLGRSPLAAEHLAAAFATASRPLALEYDLTSGKRGNREGIVAHRLRLLTGAEHATVVNNNAAAVLLVLNTLALHREVPVSRGELIEIGGSFRLPEVMERAGCQLKEVGTTNRTHAADFEQAINDRTALLLKAHPSNFRIEGFSREVAVRELAAIAHRHDLPVCIDAGSGALLDMRRFGLVHEPTPSELLAAGADLVTFSGDKLLGGVQAGIVVGKRALIEQINVNPLKRALRLDKLALTLLDAVLMAYEDEATVVKKLPLLAMLALPMAELQRRGERVASALGDVADAQVAVEPAAAQLGSGALPGETIESLAVTVAFPNGKRLRAFDKSLRQLRPAVIGRTHADRLWLDMRGAVPIDELVTLLRQMR